MEYRTSHPQLTFRADFGETNPMLWHLLGEAKSKAKHIAWSLLSPEASRELLHVYITKGMLGTTAIEGNTLSEEEARRVVDGVSRLPPSKAYLEKEIENVIGAFNTVKDELMTDEDRELTVEDILEYNQTILDGLDLEEGVVPGEIRDYSVAVGGVYRAAPARDCGYLLQRLCDWLNGPQFRAPENAPELAAAIAIQQAILAHLYLAWIHPFGDGNGRTARLLELWVLLKAGFPIPTTQLLSNHYNMTRSDYYRQLQRAGRTGDTVAFQLYAARGLVDGLQEQLDRIWAYEFEDRWEQHIYQTFGHIKTESERRRLRLMLSIPTGQPVLKAGLRRLTPEVVELYAGKTTKTLTRDVNELLEMGLIRRSGNGFLTRHDVLYGLRPRQRNGGVLELEYDEFEVGE